MFFIPTRPNSVFISCRSRSFSIWGNFAPSFVRESAWSFPGMLLWPGIHWTTVRAIEWSWQRAARKCSIAGTWLTWVLGGQILRPSGGLPCTSRFYCGFSRWKLLPLGLQSLPCNLKGRVRWELHGSLMSHLVIRCTLLLLLLLLHFWLLQWLNRPCRPWSIHPLKNDALYYVFLG